MALWSALSEDSGAESVFRRRDVRERFEIMKATLAQGNRVVCQVPLNASHTIRAWPSLSSGAESDCEVLRLTPRLQQPIGGENHRDWRRVRPRRHLDGAKALYSAAVMLHRTK